MFKNIKTFYNNLMIKKNKLKISKIKINKYFSFKIRLKMLSSKMKI